MTTVRIVVDKIEPGLKNADGGRTITIDGRTLQGEVGISTHVVRSILAMCYFTASFRSRWVILFVTRSMRSFMFFRVSRYPEGVAVSVASSSARSFFVRSSSSPIFVRSTSVMVSPCTSPTGLWLPGSRGLRDDPAPPLPGGTQRHAPRAPGPINPDRGHPVAASFGTSGTSSCSWPRAA